MKTGRLFIIGVVFGLIGLGSLVHNRMYTQSQAQTIVRSDTAGQDTSAAVASLRQYVAAHMGTSVSFALNGAYQRQLEQAQAAAQPQTSGDIYQQAQASCASIKNPIQQAHCNQDYLNSHLQQATATPVAQPSKTDYSYNFVAPLWSADAAGILIALSLAALLLAAGRLVFGK